LLRLLRKPEELPRKPRKPEEFLRLRKPRGLPRKPRGLLRRLLEERLRRQKTVLDKHIKRSKTLQGG
jgi:hypothetical protein